MVNLRFEHDIDLHDMCTSTSSACITDLVFNMCDMDHIQLCITSYIIPEVEETFYKIFHSTVLAHIQVQ